MQKKLKYCPFASVFFHICTRWFKYDRDKLWLVYTQIVPVIFEPPCTCLLFERSCRCIFLMSSPPSAWYSAQFALWFCVHNLNLTVLTLLLLSFTAVYVIWLDHRVVMQVRSEHCEVKAHNCFRVTFFVCHQQMVLKCCPAACYVISISRTFLINYSILSLLIYGIWRNSSVSIVSMLRCGWQFSISVRNKGVSFRHFIGTGSGAHVASSLVGMQKYRNLETRLLLVQSLKIGGGIPPLPVRLYSVMLKNRNDFTYT